MPFDRSGAADTINAFIRTKILRDAGARLTDDSPLLTSGIVDSFALVDFHQFLEDTFDVRIPESDFTPDRMNTIDAIVGRVAELVQHQ